MAAVSVTINGVLWDKAVKAARPVVLIGEAFLTDLEVGGGPISPPEKPPLPPVGIWPGPGPIYPPGWGPGGEHPAHPIAPGGRPPTEPPTEPPTPPISGPDWTWGWSPSQGWHPVYVPEGGKPHPPPISGGGNPPVDPNAPVVNPLPA